MAAMVNDPGRYPSRIAHFFYRANNEVIQLKQTSLRRPKAGWQRGERVG